VELTPELLVDGLSPSQVVVSPDGRSMAYVVGPLVPAGPPFSALWVAAADAATPPKQITDGTEQVEGPRWTEDSSALVFLADGRLKRIDADGGDERELLEWDGQITEFRLVVGGAIAFVGSRAAVDGKSDVIVWGTRPGDGLWLLAPGDTDRRRPEQPLALTGLGDRHVVAIEARPDGQALAVISWELPDDEPGARTARLHVLDVRDGAAPDLPSTAPDLRPIAADLPSIALDLGPAALEAGSPTWWRFDDIWHVSYLAITPPGDLGGLAVLDVAVSDEGGSPVAHRILTSGMTICPMELAQSADGPPLALFADGLDSALYRFDPVADRFVQLTAVRGQASDLAAGGTSGTGEIAAFRVSAGNDPHDVHVWRGDGELARISDTRPHYREVDWGTQQRLTWHAQDGLEIEGLLVLPPGRGRADGPFPLHVLVHGGPYGRFADLLQFEFYQSAQWLAAAGHAVLLPNPRGSQGRGHAFAMTVVGAIGGAEFTDIIAGVDLLIAEGVADAGRLSISGWSHGGFMAAWAVTRTDRFRAAVVGAGVADWGLQVAHGELGTQEAALGGSTGWEGPGPHPHDAVSPISYASAITTPVLILHGERDTNVPLSQAVYLQRALSHYGVPHQLAVYPGGGHYVARRDHQLDIMYRTRDFLARHVLGITA
jgi:dienelactone hydrolase